MGDGLRSLHERLSGGDRATRAARLPGKPGGLSSLPRAGGLARITGPLFLEPALVPRVAHLLRTGRSCPAFEERSKAAPLQVEHLHALAIAIDDGQTGGAVLTGLFDDDIARIL